MEKFTEWRNIKYFTSYKEICNTDSSEIADFLLPLFIPAGFSYTDY